MWQSTLDRRSRGTAILLCHDWVSHFSASVIKTAIPSTCQQRLGHRAQLYGTMDKKPSKQRINLICRQCDSIQQVRTACPSRARPPAIVTKCQAHPRRVTAVEMRLGRWAHAGCGDEMVQRLRKAGAQRLCAKPHPEGKGRRRDYRRQRYCQILWTRFFQAAIFLMPSTN